MNTGKRAYRWLDVARQGNIDQEEGTPVAALDNALHQFGRDNGAWCARRTDNDIGLYQRISKFGKGTMGRAERLRQINSVRVCAINDHQALRSPRTAGTTQHMSMVILSVEVSRSQNFLLHPLPYRFDDSPSSSSLPSL